MNSYSSKLYFTSQNNLHLYAEHFVICLCHVSGETQDLLRQERTEDIESGAKEIGGEAGAQFLTLCNCIYLVVPNCSIKAPLRYIVPGVGIGMNSKNPERRY